jgi:peptide/nickel transport system substrate-binding protein
VAEKLSYTSAVAPVLVTIAATVLLTGCRSEPSPASGTTSPAADARPSRGGELVASIRTEPATYNRLVDHSTAGEALALLTQAPLVYINRATDTLEPWLAESWTESADHLAYTIKLRQGVAFSDGTPLTSADVVFTFRALYDPKVESPLAGDTLVNGKPLQVSASDPSTVVVRLPSPFAPGLRLIDGVRILPRHKLERALAEGKFNDAWSVKTPLTEIAGLGPFVLTEHVSGQRMVFTRNPHYWRRDAAGVTLPYLDKLTVVVASQAAEALKLQSGETDLMTNGDIRPEDYAEFKRAADEGRLRLIDNGVGLDPNLLWFNLTSAKNSDPKSRWFNSKAFRQAISCAVDRQAIANTVYLGEAIPVYGPVTPANRTWFTDARPACEYDLAKARALFASAGLSDRNGDGTLDDATGKPVRFSMLTQADHIRARVAAVIQEQLRQIGVGVDIVPLDVGALFKRYTEGQYDSIYFGIQASATDPALNAGFWLTSGDYHFWNPNQKAPATDWERRMEDLLTRNATSPDQAERVRLFTDVQKMFVDEMPAIYFVTPKVTLAVSSRVRNPTPAPQLPQLLWSADTLAAAPAATTR